MFSPTSTAIFRFVGWSFLPGALANGAITFYHRLFRPGTPPPRAGTPQYLFYYRTAFTLLAACYFIYTLIAGVTSLPHNYYRILGVDRSVDEQGLKAAFRSFARKNHPDRPDIGILGEERFREVREAYEMLKNPVRRFAYERFGPDIISWKDCSTPREYLRRGMIASSGFHLVSAASLAGMSLFGKATSSAFWRYIILTTVFITEAYLVFSPTIPIISSESPLPPSQPKLVHSIPFLTWLLPYQQISVLHQVFVSLSICISQLTPILFPNVGRDDKDVLKAVSEVIQRIAGLGGAAEHEVNRMIQAELRALRGVRPPLSASNSFIAAGPSSSAVSADDATINLLTAEMENLLIDARLRSHPVLGAMWDRVAEEARESLLATSTSPPAGIPPPREYQAGPSSPPPGAGDGFEQVTVPTTTESPESYRPRDVEQSAHGANIIVHPASPPVHSIKGHVLEVDTQLPVETPDRSEVGSATTLHDRMSRSRSVSPFAFVGSMSNNNHNHSISRGRTTSVHIPSNLKDSELTVFDDVDHEHEWKSVRSPSPSKSAGSGGHFSGVGGGQSRSLGKASGRSLKGASDVKVNGNAGANLGARFFPSAFSSATS